MELAIKTCTLDMPFTDMLDFCTGQGIRAVEIGTGNWSSAPHIDLDAMLGSAAVRTAWMDELRRRDISLCALNCSGNPLAYEKDRQVTEKTFRLAGLLGVEKIVMMSGLPAGCPGDRTPVWPSLPGAPSSIWRRTAASGRLPWKTTGCSWCTAPKPSCACGMPWGLWWA